MCPRVPCIFPPPYSVTCFHPFSFFFLSLGAHIYIFLSHTLTHIISCSLLSPLGKRKCVRPLYKYLQKLSALRIYIYGNLDEVVTTLICDNGQVISLIASASTKNEGIERRALFIFSFWVTFLISSSICWILFKFYILL